MLTGKITRESQEFFKLVALNRGGAVEFFQTREAALARLGIEAERPEFIKPGAAGGALRKAPRVKHFNP